MYWAGYDAQCPAPAGVLCIYKAANTGGDSWGSPTVVMAPSSGATNTVTNLGEPSLTQDGRYLYFVYIQYTVGTSYNLNLGVVEHP